MFLRGTFNGLKIWMCFWLRSIIASVIRQGSRDVEARFNTPVGKVI